MKDDNNLALFLMQGQLAEKLLKLNKNTSPKAGLYISNTYNLTEVLPAEVNSSLHSAEAYMLFFVFEAYLRDFIIDVLSKENPENWWDKIPNDVKDEVQKLEQTEEIKGWMALGSREKTSLMTYPQLLRVIEHCWKDGFDELVRDKTLIQEARLISHLRNTICHMTDISDEEILRIKQTMRDWFRMISP